MGGWIHDAGFMTPVACSGSMPWKTFDACLTTLSPTAPPPTLVPTVRPMRKPIAPLTRVSCYAQSVIGFLFAALFCYASMYACVRSGMRLREPQERLCCSRSKKPLFCIGDLASNKSNRPRLIKVLSCALSVRACTSFVSF